MNKKPRLEQAKSAGSRPEQDIRDTTLTLLVRTLRPAQPDRKLARRIKQRLTAEWFARQLITILILGVACVGLMCGALRGQR